MIKNIFFFVIINLPTYFYNLIKEFRVELVKDLLAYSAFNHYSVLLIVL
jgi:hypothetical protein